MTQIRRITLFKCPDQEHQQAILDQYSILKQTAQKDGKPYIISLSASPTKPDQRSKGYTLVAISQFKSEQNMKYYDEECQGHKDLKEVAKGKLEEVPLTVWFEVNE